MANPKKQWFDVKDSLTKGERGKEYYNVQARFSDHPVINVEKSKIARRNIYDYSIVLHTQVKRNAFDAPAQPNTSSQTLRFDKGSSMGGAEFEAAKAAIMRCWDAWEHYQTYRQAPVTVAEKMAMEQIERMPLSALGTVKVDIGGGRLVDARRAGDDDDGDDEDDGPSIEELNKEAAIATAPGRSARRQAATSKPAAPRKGKSAAA